MLHLSLKILDAPWPRRWGAWAQSGFQKGRMDKMIDQFCFEPVESKTSGLSVCLPHWQIHPASQSDHSFWTVS